MGATNYLAIAVSCALATGSATVVMAGSTTPSESQQSRFAAWDKDASGSLSPVEAQQVDGLSQAFAHVDANQDGQVDAAEYATFEGVGEE